MREPRIVHGLQPCGHAVEYVDHLPNGERAAIDQSLERIALDELHHQDGLRANAGIEGHEAGDVRVARQREQRTRLFAKELHELLFGQRVGGGARIRRHLERKDLGAFLVAFFRSPSHEHGAAGARTDGPDHEESADDSTGRKPRRQMQLALAPGDARDLAVGARLPRKTSDAHERARHDFGEKRRQVLPHGLSGSRGRRPHAFVALDHGTFDPRFQSVQGARGGRRRIVFAHARASHGSAAQASSVGNRAR
jgi:hypothetical protein